MYKQVETDKEITIYNGVVCNPVVTLKNEVGGVCQIITVDGCYQVFLKHNETYSPTHYIFKEVHKSLKKLPLLPTK